MLFSSCSFSPFAYTIHFYILAIALCSLFGNIMTKLLIMPKESMFQRLHGLLFKAIQQVYKGIETLSLQ